MTSDDHKTAAEQALVDADGHHHPMIPLMRGIIHAVLALIDEGSTDG